jgi:hypothetical protein
MVKFSPGGLHFASELDVEAFTASCAVDGEEPSKDALQKALSEHAHSIVNEVRAAPDAAVGHRSATVM